MFLTLSVALLVAAAPHRPVSSKPILLHELKGHTATVRGVDFAPDGNTVASVCQGGVVNLWDVRTGKGVGGKSVGHLCSVQFSPDGKVVTTADAAGTVRLFDARSGKETKAFTAKGGELYVARFMREGKRIVATGVDPLTRIWDAAKGEQVDSIPSKTSYALALSPCDKFVAVGTPNKAVAIWDIAGAKFVREMKGHTHIVVWLEYSPDGRTLASCGYDQTIRLWDVRTGKERLGITGFVNSARVCAFSRDGRTLAAGDYMGKTHLFDTDNGKSLWVEEGQGENYAVAISPNGRLLCLGGQYGRLRLYDVSALIHRRPSAEPMDASAFETHFDDLESQDETVAYKALVALSTPSALPHLTRRLRSPKPFTEEAKKLVRQWIDDLTGEDESKYARAAEELAEFGSAIAPLLKETLKGVTDAEAKLRLIVLQRKATSVSRSELRLLRAVEALERAGVPQTAKILGELAKGVFGDATATEAKETLARLKKRVGG